MPEFYYQIKGKANEFNENLLFGTGNWVFPPIFSGKVEADNKNDAKLLIEIEYQNKFPLRVLKKDLDTNEFLLKIDVIETDRIKRLFEIKTCKFCNNTFKVIDLYNDHNETYKGHDYCSRKCKDEHYNIISFERNNINDNNNVVEYNNAYYNHPVIYKITNNKTNMCYVGKTTQVFTLRWYQHFYQTTNTKFHLAIKESNLLDWNFQIIENVFIEKDKYKTSNEINTYILERERYWINFYDCINNGYNTL